MDWNDYFLGIAEAVSKRSPDPNTKHGCVIVDSQNRILSTGYNGPVQGIDTSLVDFTRPGKYMWLLHAEDNAVTFSKCDLTNARVYVTGHPCIGCFRRLAQAGISEVYYGDRYSKCVTDGEMFIIRQIAKSKGMKLLEI